MKKKLLLIALPALMALSGCANVSLNKVDEAKELLNVVTEDTLAHDDIFGGERLPTLTNVRGLAPVDTNQPAYGIQYKEHTAEINSVVTDCISIRFVAAIKVVDMDGDSDIDDNDLLLTSASWVRTIYENDDDDGDYLSHASINCQKAYTTIYDGNDELSITDYNNANEPATDYTHFVMYSMLEIPMETYAHYYLTATLSLNGTPSQKLVGTSIDQTKQVVIDTSDENQSGFFLKGKHANGTDLVVKADVDTKGDNPLNNHASFTTSLSPNDKFVAVEYDSTQGVGGKFRIWNSSTLTGNNNPVGYYFENSSGNINTIYKGNYILYLNKSNQLWQSASNVETSGYLYVDVDVSWWGGAWTSVYAYSGDLNGVHTGKWFALTGTFWGAKFRTHTSEEFFNATTYATYTTIAVCRLKDGDNLPEDKTKWSGEGCPEVYNRYDIALKTNGLEDCVYLYNNVEYSMGSRN